MSDLLIALGLLAIGVLGYHLGYRDGHEMGGLEERYPLKDARDR